MIPILILLRLALPADCVATAQRLHREGDACRAMGYASGRKCRSGLPEAWSVWGARCGGGSGM